MTWFPLLALVACDGASTTEGADLAVCDGRLQSSEAFVDSPWDRDEDGHYDFANLFCAATYGLAVFDCDDTNPAVNASALEIPCNGVDDDCSFETPDGLDRDGDGASDCIDCDDENADRSPLGAERCFDGVDNDCDGEADEDCGPDYNGVFTLDEPITYECDFGSVSLDIVEIEVDWAPPQLSLVPATARPYFVLDGTIDDNEAVSATVLLRGTGCRQRYTLVGVFTSADTFEGTLEGEYGTATCNGCEAITSWRVSGTREAGPGKTEP